MNPTNLTHPVHYQGWIEEDFSNLNLAQNFTGLARVALTIIRRLNMNLHMVSGPISTGGVGSIPGNVAVFRGVIEYLADQGLPIFSQLPFEDRLVTLYQMWHRENPEEKYCWPILYDFYQPIFTSGFIETLHLIHGWESSDGAKWEHSHCAFWGIKRNYLPAEVSASSVQSELPHNGIRNIENMMLRQEQMEERNRREA